MNSENKNQMPAKSAPASNTETARRAEFYHGLRIYAFAGTMLLLFILGLLLFLRPTTSESEKRELTKFPAFSVETLVSGEYFNQINTWYADTYPGREGLISINNAIRELFGIRTVQLVQSKPDLPNDTPKDPSDPGTPSDPDVPVDTTPIERLGSVYVKGNTAYEVYTENKSNSKRYAELIALAAGQLGSGVKVYDIIVPLSSSVNLSEKELGQIGASDSKAAIDAMYAGMSGVTAVDAYSILREHSNEYLYFRTDHHWTALGAYYAYSVFCAVRGIPATPLSSYTVTTYDGFLGTHYSATGSTKLKADTITAYIPTATNVIHITDRGAARMKYSKGIVTPNIGAMYAAVGSQYNCFLLGDHALGEIHNETKADGSSILVVKESFGNAFVPFLVDSYEYVYVIDARYFDGNLVDFVTAHSVDEVLFINNLSATGAGARLDELQKFIG